MVQFEIEDDRDAVLVRGVYQLFELIRRAIGGLNCVEKGRIISPAKITREFIDGHELHGSDVQVVDVIVMPVAV